MKPLAKIGYSPAHRVKAMALAQTYGKDLYTGVLYRDPNPPPTYESRVRERREHLAPGAPPRHRILERFAQRAASERNEG
jgi:2-oxoglutarate ferredoxin oxidoreductase subunit beta